MRLLGEMEPDIGAPDKALAAQKGLVTKAENARAEDHAKLGELLVSLGFFKQADIEDGGFDPIAAVSMALTDTLADRKSAERSLRAQKGATTKAKNEVEALEEAAKPRPLGPAKRPRSTPSQTFPWRRGRRPALQG